MVALLLACSFTLLGVTASNGKIIIIWLLTSLPGGNIFLFLLLLVVIKIVLLLNSYYLNYESLVWEADVCQVEIIWKFFVDWEGKCIISIT